MNFIAAPIGLGIYVAHSFGLDGAIYLIIALLALLACVLSSVHQAEEIAHQLGDPFGSLLLALAVTTIEVGLIVSLMISGGVGTAALARDTIFAAIMIVLNGVMGLSLLLGSLRHHEQQFRTDGVSAALATLAAIGVLSLIYPNLTTTVPGPYYSSSQLAFIALVSLLIYGAFLFIQSSRHKEYFLDKSEESVADEKRPLWICCVFLFLGLLTVVLLAKTLTPKIETLVNEYQLPQALVGVVIAMIVAIPEGLAAVRAARDNRLQTSLNLALGSVIASIGLTIPVVAVVSLWTGWPLRLGLEPKETLLLIFSFFLASLSLNTGKTTVLHGLVHFLLFAVYLFTTIIP